MELPACSCDNLEADIDVHLIDILSILGRWGGGVGESFISFLYSILTTQHNTVTKQHIYAESLPVAAGPGCVGYSRVCLSVCDVTQCNLLQ